MACFKPQQPGTGVNSDFFMSIQGRVSVAVGGLREGGEAMPKDPAFLFYPNDYIGGTMGMSFEEKGAYIELLMLQFNRGHMTSHMIGQIVGQTWDKISSKFIQDENGLYYNQRLEEEIHKRKTFVESRKNNKTGKNQHTKKDAHMLGHMTSHMENENENEDIDLIEDMGVQGEEKRFVKPTVEEISTYCQERNNNVSPQKFISHYQSKGWKVGKTPMKDWKAAVRTWEQNDKEKNPDDVLRRAAERYKKEGGASG